MPPSSGVVPSPTGLKPPPAGLLPSPAAFLGAGDAMATSPTGQLSVELLKAAVQQQQIPGFIASQPAITAPHDKTSVS